MSECDDMRRGENHDEEEGDAIAECAARWLAERDEGLTPEQARDFECWRRADPRHDAAVAQLEQACELLGKLPLISNELLDGHASGGAATSLAKVAPFEHAPEQTLRRAWGDWRRWGAMAAAIALAAIAWWQWPAAEDDALHYATSAGGYERVTLVDGSVLEMNEATDVRVQFSASERRVMLKGGEAHFSVAHDPARPFVVRADNVAVRAVGTAFNVRIAESQVEVLVTEGKVSLGPGSTPVARTARVMPEMPFLEAGERAVIARATAVALPPPPQIERIDPTAMREALSWQERKLVFAETPLRDVVAQFNRRNLTQLVIGDAELGERLVGGVFAGDNVGAFVRLLEKAGDIAAEPGSEREIVLRRVR